MEVIEELRRLGFEIEADGDRVRVRHQSQPRPEALRLLQYIRQHKADVLVALAGPAPPDGEESAEETEKGSDDLDGMVAEAFPLPPSLPAGLRLISYAPKKPPVAVEQCSVVTNVKLFIQSSLAELEYRLLHPDTVRLGWTVPQMLDRLRQVGLVIEVEEGAADKSGK